jgi:hypothetical protein
MDVDVSVYGVGHPVRLALLHTAGAAGFGNVYSYRVLCCFYIPHIFSFRHGEARRNGGGETTSWVFFFWFALRV